MILPIGDTPNPREYTPWVNYGLIAANMAVYLFITLPLSARAVDLSDPLLLEYLKTFLPGGAGPLEIRQVVTQLSRYDLFVFAHGYKPGLPEWTDLFSSMFLHGGFFHLAGNMLFLWIYGDNVEHRLGRLGYLGVYLATGVVATLSFALIAGDSPVPLVGASGAISGVLGLYFLLFPRNRVKVLVFLFPIFLDVLLLPARLVLALYVVVDNLLPMVVGSSSNVAYGAHLGGFLAGLLVALVGERLLWQTPWGRRARLDRPATGWPVDAAQANPVDALRAALDRADRAEALSALAHLEGEDLRRLPPGDCTRLAGWLDEAGRPGAAARLLRLCLAGRPDRPDLARVYLQLGLMRLRQGQTASAYQHLLTALEHDPDPITAAQARQALAGIEIVQRR